MLCVGPPLPTTSCSLTFCLNACQLLINNKDVLLNFNATSILRFGLSDLDYSKSSPVPPIIGHYYEFLKSMFF